MMSNSYPELVEHIASLESRLLDLETESRTLLHKLSNKEKTNSRQHLELKVLHSLSDDLLAVIEAKDAYSLLTKVAVEDLEWDFALVIAHKNSRSHILSSLKTNQKQEENILDGLGQCPILLESLKQGNPVTTLQVQDKIALSLRSLFNAQEVICIPVSGKDATYGLFVVGTTARSCQSPDREISFLTILAEQLGAALDNIAKYAGLIKENDILKKQDQLKDSFISVTSHQFRTPLSIVKWVLSVLSDDQALKSLQTQHRLIEQAYDGNERLIRVVNNLLNVARVQEGRLPYNPQPYDLKVLISDVLLSARTSLEDRLVKANPDYKEDIPLVPIDPILLREALQCLLDNAINYNNPEGYVNIELYRHDDKVFIAITNSGFGIEKDEEKHLFDQYFRGEKAKKAQPSGNGLGLFLAKAIVRAHGGDITFHSQPNRETVFTVSLPVSEAVDLSINKV